MPQQTRTIGVVTSARADYGIYLPVLRRIQADPALELALIVTGMHLSPEFGRTVEQIEADGFPIYEKIEMLLSSDSPEGLSKSMGLGLIGFAQLFSRFRPDILLVLGDRFEMMAAPLAALPYRIPVAHLHGGEVTAGAIDDSLRHAMTKLSHLHFASTEVYAQRIIRMGEAPERVFVSGAPGLDNLDDLELLSAAELKARFKLHFEEAPLLVTYHPVTREYENTAAQMDALLGALQSSGLPLVFTLPNADTANSIIMQKIRDFAASYPQVDLVDTLGTQGYFSMMAIAAAMVGNSSSGIVEAPSFGLPVVNIGSRQAGRVRAANVLDVGYDQAAISAAIQRATSPEFRASLSTLISPYRGGGPAAEIIVEALKAVPLDAALMSKGFYDG